MNHVQPQRPWSDEQLAHAIEASTSWRAVLRTLGLRPNSAGHARAAQRRAVELGIDTSHFRGTRTWSDAQLCRAVSRAKTWGDVLEELGLSGNSGNARPLVKSHAVRLGLDCSHLSSMARLACPTLMPSLEHLREAAPSVAMAWFLSCGCPVSVPLEPAIFDLLVSMPDSIKRVQVKSTTFRSQTGWQVGVGRHPYTPKSPDQRAPYDPDEIDFFFIFDGDLTMYLIPSQVIAGRVSISLSTYQDYIVGSAKSLMSGIEAPEVAA